MAAGRNPVWATAVGSDTNGGPPLFGDDSYQGPPVEDFDNSRAGAVVSFAQDVNVGAQGAAPKTSTNDNGSVWSAWSDAASKGERPLDFGFLIDKSRENDDVSSNGSPLAAGSLAKAVAGSDRKRSRVAQVSPFAKDATEDTTADVDVLPCPPPCPPKRLQKVVFGKVDGENRGPNPMAPPAVRTDMYSWMRSPGHEANEEVMALMKEENQHALAAQSHLSPLHQQLYEEMMGHQKETDISLISLHRGGFGYFNKTFQGKSYQVHYRRPALEGGAWGPEELVFDENEFAVDENGSRRPYCCVSGPHPSPDHALFAYATDFVGNSAYTLKVNSFAHEAREWLQVKLERTDGSAHWGVQGECVYYVQLDDEFRPYKVRRHVPGDDPSGSADVTLLEEADKRFWLSACESSCCRFLVLTTASAGAAEVHLLDLASPSAGLRRVASRLPEHMYSVDHRGGWLYVLTNKDGVRNSKLCRVSLAALPDVPLASWEDVWVPGDGTSLDSHRCFQSFVAIEGREKGECRIFVHGYGEAGGPPLHTVAFPDAAAHSGTMLTPRGATAARAAFSAGLGDNRQFDTDVVRYGYSSFTIPGLTYEYHVRTREHRLLRNQEAPRFEPALYRAERITTPRRKVPISLVYRRDLHPQGLAGGPFPTLLTGYGAYGCCQDPDFDGNRLSLLDRGVVYAVAHVRGGGELGCEWRDQGKLLAVKNRFADFVEAAETLVSLRVSSPEQLAAWGTSSGGLLVAASMNLRPDLFRVVLLEVPFVDAMNTMRDPSIPLTVGEWEEVGNPNEREYFYYMLEYSPYDNIRAEVYPAALVTSSLNDSMVGYWEPLKYVTKLRDMKADNRPVLLRANFYAGHGGSADRYENTRECAFQFAFMLDQLGVAGAPLHGAEGRR